MDIGRLLVPLESEFLICIAQQPTFSEDQVSLLALTTMLLFLRKGLHWQVIWYVIPHVHKQKQSCKSLIFLHVIASNVEYIFSGDLQLELVPRMDIGRLLVRVKE